MTKIELMKRLEAFPDNMEIGCMREFPPGEDEVQIRRIGAIDYFGIQKIQYLHDGTDSGLWIVLH